MASWAGYGAAQAVPGPLFTFAAYLGAIVQSSTYGLAGAALGLIGIFLPGMLIFVGALPFWDTFRRRAGAQAVMRGVNAAVVGLLGAALYSPVWVSSVKTPGILQSRSSASSSSPSGARRLSSSLSLAQSAASSVRKS